MIEILRAAPTDRSMLREIAIESKAYWGYEQSLIDQFAGAEIINIESIENDPVYKAMQAGALAGWYRLKIDLPESELEDLWVLPAEMGGGIGRAMFKHACAESRVAGCTMMIWDADPNAVGFYEKMGAAVIGQSWSGWQRYIPRMRIEL